MKHITLAFDSFKGSMSSLEVADAFANALCRMLKECDIRKVAISDGGEGMTASILNSCGGEWQSVEVSDPLGRRRTCRYALVDSGATAVIELAAASGLTLLAPDERNPLITSTYGLGEILRDALDRGCQKIMLGIGGSATNDGGVGMLQALGYRFLDAAGCHVEGCGAALQLIKSIDDSGADIRLRGVDVVVACDVDNPLYGEHGAAYVYAPQKGADEAMVIRLDEGLRNYGEVLAAYCGRDVSQVSGAGAAGGVGAALVAVVGARLERGIDMLLEAIAFEDTIRGCDLVVTGEGRIDSQTLCGKVPMGILNAAKRHALPVVAIGGSVEHSDALYRAGFCDIVALTDGSTPLSEAMRKDVTTLNIERAAEYVARKYLM